MVGKQEVIRFLPVDVITRPASRRPCCGVTLTARAAAREQTFRVVSTAWDVHEFLWHTCLPQGFLAVYNRTPKMARHTGGEEIMHRKTFSGVLGRTQPSLSSKIHPSVFSKTHALFANKSHPSALSKIHIWALLCMFGAICAFLATAA